MPRPLHHWKSFWLGLLVAVFLGWAWWDSHHYFSRLTWVGKGLAWNGAGKIGCSLFPQNVDAPFEFVTSRMPLGSIRLELIFAKFKTYTFPHWLILTGVFLTWSSFLLWRWQRMKRLARNST